MSATDVAKHADDDVPGDAGVAKVAGDLLSDVLTLLGNSRVVP